VIWDTTVIRMARKNLKVPENLFLALRDDKPDHMSWPTYLETRCLGESDVSQPYPDEMKRTLERIQSATETVEERTGKMQKTLEEMGGR